MKIILLERKCYKCILIAFIWMMGAINVFAEGVNSTQLPVVPDRTAEAISHFPNRLYAFIWLVLAKHLYILSKEDSCIGFEASNHYWFVPGDLIEKVISCRYILRELNK
ncbi:MAG: hypothetical protein WCR86_10010 [Parabacteroides sp.]